MSATPDQARLADAPAAAEMDRIYRWQRFIYDLTRKYYLLGRDRLIAEVEAPPGSTILEIGCGTGRNLVALARQYPGTHLFGVDVSAAMLDTGRRSVARAGLADRVRLAQADATAFSPQDVFGVLGFDRVVVSYTLSMVPAWREALEGATRSVAPGGCLMIVDFGSFAGLPRWFGRAQVSWLERFHVRPVPGLGKEVGALASLHHMTASSTSLYGDYAVRMDLCRHEGHAPRP